MSVELKIKTLSSELRQGLEVLSRMEARLERFAAQTDPPPSGDGEDAIVVTHLLSSYYTCLETLFLRISRFFENSLPAEKWHQALLDKMTLEIEGLRPRVLSGSVRNDLRELLKFRHFIRYYFELDYDWDRLTYLLKKYQGAREPVRKQLTAFDDYLQNLLDS